MNVMVVLQCHNRETPARTRLQVTSNPGDVIERAGLEMRATHKRGVVEAVCQRAIEPG